MRQTSCKNRTGFTLAEAMLATVVLGIAAGAVLLPFTSGAKIRAEGMRRTLATKLAADLTEQIINTDFDQIVDSYNGYLEPQGQVKDAAGVIFTDPAYAGFSRQVSCEYVRVPQESSTGQLKFIRVTVQVCYNASEVVNLSRLISR